MSSEHTKETAALAQVKRGVKGFVEVPIQERLAGNAKPSPNGCLLWTGVVGPLGYGYIWYKRRSHRVHRLVWELAKGPIPSGLYVCHSCDVRNCINLAHLWLGTHQQNMHDASVKGRIARGRGRKLTPRLQCKRGHPYTPENTRTNKWQRRCLTCLLASWKRKNDKRTKVRP